MIQRIFLALAVSISVSPALFAQTQTLPKPLVSQTPATKDEKDDVVRITTNLVQIDALVLRDGKPVKDLKPEDFDLFEDGRRQAITSFSYVSTVSDGSSAPRPAPDGVKTPRPINPSTPHRTIALVIDDLGLSFESMSQVRRQVRKFIAEQVQPDDLVAVMRTGGTLGALQQFTNDRRITDRAVNQLKWNICSRVGVNLMPPAGRQGSFVPSSLYGPCGSKAAVWETLRALRFVVEAMGDLPGRKTMVVFSDSLPREEQELNVHDVPDRDSGLRGINPDSLDYNAALYRIAEKAIRGSVVIYGVDSGGLATTGITAADKLTAPQGRAAINELQGLLTSRSQANWYRREGAQLIATETGGFLVRNSNSFLLDRIIQEESGYYLIGYRPSDETFDKRFHRIKVKVKRSGMSVRTRHGFYGFTEEEANAQLKRSPAAKAAVALMSPFGAQQIELDLTAFFADEKVKGSFVRSFVYLKASDLTFEEDADGWHSADVQFRGIVFGDNGAIENEVTHDRKLSFRGETFQQALRSGLAIEFDMPVKKSGSFQVRVSARDIRSGHIGSTGQFVQVPNLKKNELAVSGVVLQGISSATLEPDQETAAGPALRQFTRGQRVRFSCAIYNAMPDATGKPNVVLQARLFREAKEVYDSTAMTVALDNQLDLTRLLATGLVQLDPKLETGNYYLQLTVTDKLRPKQEPIVQWIDFEIVK